ncbi:unnamed protein product [Arabis nemorensis]|uniref:RING-type E3 ubiquitin transferase n=1 Tax=Arabis nemorensis TaxID=586526 RepID=A0A565C6A4_9BRAS|nr:unnamed protein product [Arabis nemorensis]
MDLLEADYFNSITRVSELKGLDDLLKGKTMNPLVVVSGRVASAAPFECKHNGPLGFVYENKFEVDSDLKWVDGELMDMSINVLLRAKQTPWYLEDNTGRVNVVVGYDAVGFSKILKEYVGLPNMKSESDFCEIILSAKEGSKVVYRDALDIGRYLTFVGEAARDKAGNLMIQKPKEQPFRVFDGEGSFDKMVDKLKSNSEFYIFYSKIFGTVAVAVAIVYGVDFIRWKKKNSGNNS